MTTTYRALLDAGQDHVLDSISEPHSRQVSIAAMELQDGEIDPIVGLHYSCDFKAEEEWGQAALREKFSTGSGPDTTYGRLERMSPNFTGASHPQSSLIHVSDTQWVLMTDPLERRPLTGERNLLYALSQQRRMLVPGAPRLDGLERHTVPELRAMARDEGLRVTTQMRKPALIKILMEHLTPKEALTLPGWFQDGRHLVLPRGHGAFRIVTDRLIAAAERGSLAVGGSGLAAFGAGVSLFDFDDMPAEEVKKIYEARVWRADRMAELEPVIETLSKRGHKWYFLGDPRMISKTTTLDGAQVRYWLNGQSYRLPNGKSAQPYGWYSLKELLAEKFIDDLLEKQGLEPSDRADIRPGF